MNPVTQQLLQVIEKDPLPDKDTSSYWKLWGGKAVVEKRGGDLNLKGIGFGYLTNKPHIRFLGFLERLSYRNVSARVKDFPSVWRSAKELARDLSIGTAYDLFKYSMALCTIKDHCEAHRLSPKTFLVIGDGYGVFGALTHRVFSGSRIYFIDLPKILIFQVQTQELAHPQAEMKFITEKDSKPAEINFVLPQHIENISETIDFAVNMSSMQEMKMSSIQEYFSFLRRRSGADSRFYCVNRQRFQWPDGEVTEFYKYPWRPEDAIFIDEPCPYQTHFFSYRRGVNAFSVPTGGPRLLGLRIPFINHFDGVTIHRLVHLAPEK